MVRPVFHIISVLLSQASDTWYPGSAQLPQLPGKWPFTLGLFAAGPRQGVPINPGFHHQNGLQPEGVPLGLRFQIPAGIGAASLHSQGCPQCGRDLYRAGSWCRGLDTPPWGSKVCGVCVGHREGPTELCPVLPFIHPLLAGCSYDCLQERCPCRALQSGPAHTLLRALDSLTQRLLRCRKGERRHFSFLVCIIPSSPFQQQHIARLSFVFPGGWFDVPLENSDCLLERLCFTKYMTDEQICNQNT